MQQRSTPAFFLHTMFTSLPPRPAIVLLPGFLGFNRLIVWHMFNGVKQHLEETGWQVVQPLPNPVGSIEERCRDVAEQIVQLCGPTAPLHLIGHSMGGLDARYIASPAGLGWGDRVRSVTTLATPHRGSRAAERLPPPLWRTIQFASRATWRLIPFTTERTFLKKLAARRWDALSDLTPQYLCDIFNQAVVDDPQVRYFSYAAVLDPQTTGALGVIRRIEGRLSGVQSPLHDGVVELESTRWGEFIRACPTDHAGIIGLHPLPWRKPSFDHLALFAEIAERLVTVNAN